MEARGACERRFDYGPRIVFSYCHSENSNFVSGFRVNAAAFGGQQFMFFADLISITSFEFTQIEHRSHGGSSGTRTAFELVSAPSVKVSRAFDMRCGWRVQY